MSDIIFVDSELMASAELTFSNCSYNVIDVRNICMNHHEGGKDMKQNYSMSRCYPSSLSNFMVKEKVFLHGEGNDLAYLNCSGYYMDDFLVILMTMATIAAATGTCGYGTANHHSGNHTDRYHCTGAQAGAGSSAGLNSAGLSSAGFNYSATFLGSVISSIVRSHDGRCTDKQHCYH